MQANVSGLTPLAAVPIRNLSLSASSNRRCQGLSKTVVSVRWTFGAACFSFCGQGEWGNRRLNYSSLVAFWQNCQHGCLRSLLPGCLSVTILDSCLFSSANESPKHVWASACCTCVIGSSLTKSFSLSKSRSHLRTRFPLPTRTLSCRKLKAIVHV